MTRVISYLQWPAEAVVAKARLFRSNGMRDQSCLHRDMLKVRIKISSPLPRGGFWLALEDVQHRGAPLPKLALALLLPPIHEEACRIAPACDGLNQLADGQVAAKEDLHLSPLECLKMSKAMHVDALKCHLLPSMTAGKECEKSPICRPPNRNWPEAPLRHNASIV